MFAALVLERDPLRWAQFPAALMIWTQDVGGFAFVLMLLWLLLTRGRPAIPLYSGWDESSGSRRLMMLALAAAGVGYALLGAFRLPELYVSLRNHLTGAQTQYTPFTFQPTLDAVLLTAAGACAIFAALLPFLLHLADLRWRRIGAIARLTMLEVVRRRILWVFALLALVFLFGTWFIQTKAENQVRVYVQVVYLAVSVLLLLTGSLLASFGLPTDIRTQTIHTVVTKPVERFEIVLGRFLGLMSVLSVMLVAMTAFSLIYVMRGVDPDAEKESLRARVEITGDLKFEGTSSTERGENVGEEWDYRSYINGPMPGTPYQYAIWDFRDLPSDFARVPQVPCEYTFYIYRTTKGEENKAVYCNFAVATGLCPLIKQQPRGDLVPVLKAEIDREREKLLGQPNPPSRAEVDNLIAAKYGYWELRSQEVFNYHTQQLQLPGGLFKNQTASRQDVQARVDALKDKAKSSTLSPGEDQELGLLEADLKGEPRPPLRVLVRCVSSTQFLGMARYDLYMLAAEQPFWLNFFKGAIGIWFWMALVTGVAVSCSTLLAGVISWICTVFLFVIGLLRDHVEKVSQGTNEGGGPGESLLRLLGRGTLISPIEEGTPLRLATTSDVIFRWTMRRVLDVIPDVWRYDFTDLVANGFDISWAQLTITLVYLIGYLLPWGILAYYLMKSREIATW